jgi:hypothetical protein
MKPTAAKYNKDQWISSFEDEMVRLRPHMTARVLASICLMAWSQYGVKGTDPHQAARTWSASMDGSPTPRR